MKHNEITDMETVLGYRAKRINRQRIKLLFS